MNFLPVLNYHGIDADPNEFEWKENELPYVLRQSRFEEQVGRVSKNGCTAMSLEGLKKWLNWEMTIAMPLLITFDDGHLSHYRHVMPLLKKYGLPAFFFISAGLIGKKDQMGWHEIKELSKEGFDIGSHGMNHIPLHQLSVSELEREVTDSKKVLEDGLGRSVDCFSIPRGYYHPRIRQKAIESGYQFQFTSHFDVNPRNRDPYQFSRLCVLSRTSHDDLERWLKGNLGFKKVRESLKENARRWMPHQVYDKLADLKRSWS